MLKKTNDRLMLTDRAYSRGKKLVQVILPAIGALYFGLAAIWNLPAAEQVVGTLAVVTTFLGVCLGVSSKHYDESGAGYDGTVFVTPGDEDGANRKFEIALNDPDPNSIVDKESFKVKVEKVA